MTACSRGDVVLVSFAFTDESGAKRRPAVVVSSYAYHESRQEAIIAAITSRTDRNLVGDHPITDWRRAGLLFPSVATGIIRTIRQTMIERKLGVMPRAEMQAVEDGLRDALGLRAV